MQRQGVVYKIECSGNGGVYIGSTMRTMKQRWAEHLHHLRKGKHHSERLQRCYAKYGEESLTITSEEEVPDINILLAREQFHIWRHERSGLLNSQPVSDAVLAARKANTGRKMSQSERKARSIALKKAFEGLDYSARFTDEVRAKLSAARRARKMKPVSDETRRRISIANKGKKTSRKAIEASVATRQAFIAEEVASWLAMRMEGMSYREIERRTGRCRRVLARECKKLAGSSS